MCGGQVIYDNDQIIEMSDFNNPANFFMQMRQIELGIRWKMPENLHQYRQARAAEAIELLKFKYQFSGFEVIHYFQKFYP